MWGFGSIHLRLSLEMMLPFWFCSEGPFFLSEICYLCFQSFVVKFCSEGPFLPTKKMLLVIQSCINNISQNAI
jgi:hypothetical protein